MDIWKERIKAFAAWAKNHHNVLLFIGGFLFDVFTLNRIDSWVDLGIQLAYLTGLTFLLLGQHRVDSGLWRPREGFIAKAWAWNLEAVHFLYGGLLSNYVVFYAKSASGLRPWVFFLFLVVLMVANEMPAIRRFGHRLRLGLYAFCVASFLIYFVPVLVGRMGDWVFVLSIGLAALVVWAVAGRLALGAPPEFRARYRQVLAWPAMTVLTLMSLLYVFRLVPPVPLSVKFHGVYHNVAKVEGDFLLRSTRPPFWAFWRGDSRPFLFQSGDKAYYFARIFAPTRFRHRISIRWEEFDPKTEKFVSRALVPVAVSGGREQGFRAHSSFSALRPGRWRVGVETENGRLVGRLRFRVKEDGQSEPRRWAERTM